MSATRIPEPECLWGYSEQQVMEMVGDQMQEFFDYMILKAHMRCIGQVCPEAHGYVYYRHDVLRFVDHRLSAR